MDRPIKRLTRTERLLNTVSGNPRYRLHFEDGTTINTKGDAAIAYSISESWIGKQFALSLDAKGQIINMHTVEETP